jgi:secernin
MSWSCDTFVAQRDSTTGGRLVFGKNSDRPAGEVQPLRVVPSRRPGGTLRLAYVSLPDEGAFAHLGSAPFWCWGYEFGVNERGVVIGNEAQFTRSWAESVDRARRGDPPTAGILGMELVRIGLERGGTARDALSVMTRLLEEHGQWGSGVFGEQPVDGAYDNSYLIADRDDAWVLETCGREWVARRVASGVYSISNEPSIRGDFDLRSDNLLTRALERGWMTEAAPFDYAASHVDPMTPLQVSHLRRRRSQQLISSARDSGGVGIAAAKQVLRDHYEGTFLDGPAFNAARPDFLTLCMHEHPAGFTWGNTAASIILEQGADDDDLTVLWYTPLPPCVGAYIPVFLQAVLPDPSAQESPGLPEELLLPAPAEPLRPPEATGRPHFDPASYWWRAQNLLDVAKGDADGSEFTERRARLRERFDPLEAEWSTDADTLRRQWRAAGADGRRGMLATLRAQTARAVRQVDAETESFFAEFAPEAASEAFDPRWA